MSGKKGFGDYLGQMQVGIERDTRKLVMCAWVRDDGRLRTDGYYTHLDYYVIDRFKNDDVPELVRGQPFDIEKWVERDKAIKKSMSVGSQISETFGFSDFPQDNDGVMKAVNCILGLLQEIPQDKFEKAIKNL